MNDLLSLVRDASPGGPWLAVGIDAAAKAILILAAAGLLALALRQASAAARHLAWGLGLAGALAVLPLSALLPRLPLPVLPGRSPASEAGPSGAATAIAPGNSRAVEQAAAPGRGVPLPGAAVPQDRLLFATEMGPEATPARPAGSDPVRLPSPAALALACWAAGAAIVLTPLVVATARTRRLARRSGRFAGESWGRLIEDLSARLGLARQVVLLKGEAGTMPMTWGVRRPVVSLPEDADDWSEERRRVVLLHELAHVRRRDCLTQWLGRTACAVYWFNPLAWWAARRLRVERERACDDLVLNAGERASAYAGHLLELAGAFRAPDLVSAAAVAMARPSQLEGRLLAILDARTRRIGPPRGAAILGLAATIGIAAPLAGLSLQARELQQAGRPGPEEIRAVSGAVVGPGGEPARGAAVVLFATKVASNGPWEDRRGSVLGRAECDAEGRFRIEAAGDRLEADDDLRLIAMAPGAGVAVQSLGDLAGPIGDPIRLTAELPLDVRLVDLEGSPLVGAEVRLGAAYPAAGGEGLGLEALTPEVLPGLGKGWTTDADGRFTLRGIGPDHSIALQVRSPSFGQQILHHSMKEDARAATLTLGRAHVLEGRVTLGEGGPPAAGALVRARSMSQEYGTGMVLGRAEMLTDADGRYRLECAPAGALRIEAYPPRQGADEYLLRGHLVVLKDATRSRVDFALPKGVLVRGRVTDTETGRPIAGARITHEAHERNNPYFIKGKANWFNGDEQFAITADDGTYRLGVMPGPGYLLVQGPTSNYLHEEISTVELKGQLIWPNSRHYPAAYRKLEPKPDAGPVDLELALRPGATVRGHVVGPDGTPERDAVLFSRWYQFPSDLTVNFSQRTMPVRSGRFELGGCDPSSTAPVFFLDAKHRRGAVVEVSGKQAGDDLKVELQPCGTGIVRFVDDKGKPLAAGLAPAHLEIVLTPGASFADIGPNNEKSPLMADAIHVANLDRGRYSGLKTDAEGRMTFPTLIPGATYRVVVFNQPVKTQIEFTVKPGEAKDLGDLAIRNIDQAG